jgi:hypothetical protein
MPWKPSRFAVSNREERFFSTLAEVWHVQGIRVRQSGLRLFGGAEGQKILSSFDRILQAPEQLLQILVARDKVDL